MKRAEFKAQRGNPRHHCLEAFAERNELGIRRISDFHVIDRRQRRWQSGIGKRGRAAAATTRADDFARKFITLLLFTVTPDATCAGERSSARLQMFRVSWLGSQVGGFVNRWSGVQSSHPAPLKNRENCDATGISVAFGWAESGKSKRDLLYRKSGHNGPSGHLVDQRSEIPTRETKRAKNA